ncbi:MAG: DUF4912 domain-containing protein [Elusimicrobiales bacterium]|nr:DUF4912 domain-containing protein [Elusimicrobiales bacterium]
MSSSSSKKLENQNIPDNEYKTLPEGYGETEAVLLPRDPYWMYIYWEITENSVKNLISSIGIETYSSAKKVIRVYEISEKDEFLGFFDIPVIFEARNWYINVKECGKTYLCEIGIITPDGRFIGIVKTNKVSLPRAGVSDIIDEKWMIVNHEFEKLLEISGVDYIGKGSAEIAKSLAQRWEMLKSVFSRVSSFGISSFSSHEILKEKEKEKVKNFWLVADCEVVVYGATEPNATLIVGDRKINLNPDGTFALRYALGDGNIVIPIRAVSQDGTMKRGITFKISRETTKDE